MDFEFPCLDNTCIQVFETQNAQQQTTVAENVLRFYNFVIRKIRKNNNNNNKCPILDYLSRYHDKLPVVPEAFSY